MELDLSRALHEAAARGTAHRAPLAVDALAHRVRRRRATRRAVEGTLGVAAVGAVALGAVQVTALRDPQPVAPVATAPPPSPSAEPAPLAAVTLDGEVACGSPLPAVVDPAHDADVRFEPTGVVDPGDPPPDPGGRPGLTLVPGGELGVRARLVNGTTQDLDATAAGPLEVWFVADGSVVGRLDAAPGGGAGAALTGAAGAVVSEALLTGTVVACGDDGALPPADYGAYVVQEVRLADGTTARLTGAPLPVRVMAAEPGTGTPADGAPAVDPHPELDRLVVTTSGLGPLAVGVPPATNPGAAMIELDPDACAGFADGADAARWVPSGYPDVVVDGEPRPPFRVDADDEAVRWVDVVAPAIRTPEGAGIGTTLTDLRSMYPDLQGPFDGPVSRVWWLTGTTGTLVLETQDDALGLQPPGTPETVVLVRVLAAGLDPAFATANSDHVAGGCL